MLSRPLVVAAALRIIDSEGLAACSTPRLAREFGVRAPSLYHHFTDRADIMAEVARLVVRETKTPPLNRDEPWTEWFVAMGVNFRRTILRHPNVAPILLEFLPRDVLSALYDNAARIMTLADVPVQAQALILDGLETLTIGAAIIHASKSPETREVLFASLDRETEPALAAAVDANPWRETEELFAVVIRSLLRGALIAVEQPAH
ncbi:MAG: TetR/AcrR family transcriptional regulator [Sporichthyaceae bacterium]